MLKAAVKSVLPQSALNTARRLCARKDMSFAPRLDFPLASLKSADSFSPDAAWNDPQIARAWAQDFDMIRMLVRDEDLHGGVNPGDRRAIYCLIRALRPKNVLEIGTHIGMSSVFIARALASAGNGGRLTTVDIYNVNDPGKGQWLKCGAKSSPRGLLRQAGCEDIVTFSAGGALPHMRATKEKYDFIFLDGDHSAAAVYREISAALQVLAPGGTILLHDVFPGGEPLYPDNNIIYGPWLAARRIARETPGFTLLPLGLLPWPTKQGTQVTSLALALRA